MPCTQEILQHYVYTLSTRIVPDEEDQNCWCCCCSIVRAKGLGGVEGGLESKGEGSWFQARDLRGWEFATMSKTLVFQVSGFFLFTAQGVTHGYYYLYSCVKYKDRILCVQVKNKPCVVYTVMRLIPWKHSHGSVTRMMLSFSARYTCWAILVDQPAILVNQPPSVVFLYPFLQNIIWWIGITSSILYLLYRRESNPVGSSSPVKIIISFRLAYCNPYGNWKFFCSAPGQLWWPMASVALTVYFQSRD